MERGGVTVSEADQLSPVELTTKAATTLNLSPLQWSNYNSTPDAVHAKNAGFTVMIQASYSGEVPYLSSGPLSGKYNFSQIHFHWGEHDETGSAHSVDGVRYPLEMHVVHIKKECANLKEAGMAKDGIAIAVHLFSLKEERNTNLDQLTAVLQFIQKPNCCANLYPSSLSEIVLPFSKDYFLYWGAVSEPYKQRFRIVWLVSRTVLPVSSQQLQQFRRLYDGRGNFILSNSSNPHPLGDRILFLISPTENTSEMLGISQQSTRHIMTLESMKSIEIHNAEFKSLVALEDAEVGSCMICPHKNHAEYETANKFLSPMKITEYDTSVEESCIDLGAIEEAGVVKTKFKEKEDNHEEHTTQCSNSCSPKYIPSQDMYSVISANEKEIRVKRKPLVVRKSDPSSEEACMFLTKPSSVHSAQSAPSLTKWGYLSVKKEYTNISDSPQRNNSSGTVVLQKNMESGVTIKYVKRNEHLLSSNDQRNEDNRPISTQKSEDVHNFLGKDPHIVISQAKYPVTAVSRKSSDKEGIVPHHNSREKQLYTSEIFDDRVQTEYLLVKQAEPKKSCYKVVGELLLTPDSKRTLVKHENNTNEKMLAELDKSNLLLPPEEESSKKTNVVYNKVVISLPPSAQESNKNQTLQSGNQVQVQDINKNNSKTKPDKNSRYRINLRVKNPVSDHENLKEIKDGPPIEYYVTKITPVKSTRTENTSMEKKLYYAKAILMGKEVITGTESQLHKTPSSIKYEASHTTLKQMDNIKKDVPNNAYSQYSDDNMKEQEVNVEILDGYNDVSGNRIPNSLEGNRPSNHNIKKKQVKVIAPYEKTSNTKITNSPGNKIDFTPSLQKNFKTKTEDLKGSDKPVGNLKSKTISSNNNYQQYSPEMDTASNEYRKVEKNSHQYKPYQTERTEMASSVKSQDNILRTIEFKINENLKLDTKKSNISCNKTKSVDSIPQMEKNKENTLIRDHQRINTVNSSESAEIIVEELAENLVYSSQKSKKKITFQVTKPTYKLPNQPPVVVNKTSSQHLITLKKVEIPDPYYLTRAPRSPLVEYEAFPVGRHQQVEIFETEEKSSEVETNKTFSSFKSGSRKDLKDESVPTVFVSNKSKKLENKNPSETKTADPAIRITASAFDQLLDRNKDYVNVKFNNENENQRFSRSPNINKKETEENIKQITFNVYQSTTSSLDENSYAQENNKKSKVKKTRIIIGSHLPRSLAEEESKLSNKIITNQENNKADTVETMTQTDQPVTCLSNHQNKHNDIQNIKLSVNNTVITTINPHDKEPSKYIIPAKRYEPEIKCIDVATSNPSKSLEYTYQLQQPAVLNYAVLQEEPMKDPLSVDKEVSTHFQPQSNRSNTEVISVKNQDNEKENSFISTQLNINNTSMSTQNTDGEANRDAIIYIQLPKSEMRSSSKQFNVDETEDIPTPDPENSTEKGSELIQETGSEQIISISKKPSIPQKSLSVNMYQPTKRDSLQEELISSHVYDSSKEKIMYSPHCNVTFTNEAEMELPGGERAHMKSMAEVRFSPVAKSTTPKKKPARLEVKPSVMVTMDQPTVTTKDMCCSAIDFEQTMNNSNNNDSADTSTSVEDELIVDEHNSVNYSPLNIITDNILFKKCPSLQFIDHWNRDASEDALLENNGKTLRATLLDDANMPTLRGGPLKGDYIFAELHFHWGRKDCCGAEHVIDNERHSMEAHFMYFKKEYGVMKEALMYEDGIAVVSIQMNVGGPPHSKFGNLIKDIGLIREAETGVYVPAESLFSWVKETVKKAKGYFSYKGTMTTEPPLIEAVTWLIFQEPIVVCCQQSLEFRKLMSPNGELLLKIHRTPQPLSNGSIFYVPM